MEQSKGQAAYEAHRAAHNRDLLDDDPQRLDPWDELPELLQRTWEHPDRPEYVEDVLLLTGGMLIGEGLRKNESENIRVRLREGSYRPTRIVDNPED